MNMVLGVDHRANDGAGGAALLRDIKAGSRRSARRRRSTEPMTGRLGCGGRCRGRDRGRWPAARRRSSRRCRTSRPPSARRPRVATWPSPSHPGRSTTPSRSSAGSGLVRNSRSRTRNLATMLAASRSRSTLAGDTLTARLSAESLSPDDHRRAGALEPAVVPGGRRRPRPLLGGNDADRDRPAGTELMAGTG